MFGLAVGYIASAQTIVTGMVVDENDQPLDLLGDLLLFIQKIQAVIIKILREYLLGIVL